MPETRRTLYRNWVKGGLGLLYTKEGIQDFVAAEIQRFHTNIYNNVLRSKGLPTGSKCSSCTIENTLPCPTFGICSARNCRFHDRSDPSKSYRPCPSGICDQIRDEIITVHRHGKPSFKNTTAQLWCISSWELAKCFMAPTGYQDKQTPDDTDISGLISVILNHLDFQTIIHENLTAPGNIFEKGRDIRNEVMHNARMEIATNDLNNFYQTFIDILSDGHTLKTLPSSVSAINKIQQLKHDLITITTEDEQKIHQESQTALKRKRDEFIEDLDEKTREGVNKLCRMEKITITKIEDKKNKVILEQQKFLKSGLDRLRQKEKTVIRHIDQRKRVLSKEVDFKTNRGKIQIDNTTAVSIEEIVNTKKEVATLFQTEVKNVRKRFSESVDNAVDESNKKLLCKSNHLKRKLNKKGQQLYESINDKSNTLYRKHEQKIESLVNESTQSSIDKIKDEETRAVQAVREEKLFMSSVNEAEYYEKRAELKSEVIEHYLSNGYTKSAISALIDDEEVDIEEIFVMPSMKTIVHGSFEASKDIRCVDDLFIKDNQPVRKVCVSSDAGRGKTTLCQWLVSSWCKSHDVDTKYSELNTTQQFLKSFEFLFYIPLRNHKVSNVVDMIRNEIVREELHELLSVVLKRDSRNCLIVLDGFDEWLPSQDCSGKLPFIDPREKYSVLITSRPWKLEVLRPKMSEIGQEIQIKGLRDEEQLIKVIVGCLEKRFRRAKNTESFFEEVKTKKTKQLSEIPILLTQMVCMWYDDVQVGNTYVEIYSQMINYIFQVGEKRHKELYMNLHQQYQGKGKKPIGKSCLPKVLKNLPLCYKYENTLLKLSELAYHTLFNEERENVLVFPRFVTEIYNMAESDVQFCLSIGLLSQAKFCNLASAQTKRLSFLHKTFQEFFAALYISDCGDDTFAGMLSKLKSLDNALEMSQVLVFLSGLDSKRVLAISQHIALLGDNDERVLFYRQYFTDVDSAIIGNIQSLVYNCIKEASRENTFQQDVILHDFGDNVTDIDTNESFSYLNSRQIMSFRMRYPSNKDLPFNWIKFEGTNLVKVIVELSSNSDHFDHLMRIIENCLPRLTTLGISGLAVSDEDCQMKSILDLIDKSKNLSSLWLRNFNITHSVLHDLVTFLVHKSCLNEIFLMNIKCLTCLVCNYNVDFANQKKLKYINICGMDGRFMLDKSLPLLNCSVFESKCDWSLINSLRDIQSLRELFIFGRHNPMLPPTAVPESARAVNKMRENHIDQVRLAKGLANALHTFHNSKRLTLICVHCKQQVLRLSSDMNLLEDVILQRVTMTLKCVKEFIDSLMDVRHKVTVAAFYIYLTPDDDLSTAEKYIETKSYVKINDTPKVDNALCIQFSNKPDEFLDAGLALPIAIVAKCDKKLKVAQEFFIWRKCLAPTKIRWPQKLSNGPNPIHDKQISITIYITRLP